MTTTITLPNQSEPQHGVLTTSFSTVNPVKKTGQVISNIRQNTEALVDTFSAVASLARYAACDFIPGAERVFDAVDSALYTASNIKEKISDALTFIPDTIKIILDPISCAGNGGGY